MRSHDAAVFPSQLYLAAEVRELDRVAIEEHGVPGLELMERAARFALHTLLKRWPKTEHIVVLCGSGNNAGDGYLLAALAHKRNIPSICHYLSDPNALQGDALAAYELCKGQNQNQNTNIRPFDEASSFNEIKDLSKVVLVDALLGTGLSREVSHKYAQAIEQSNASALPVLSIDIPSGLSADTGQAQGIAITADTTATFIGNKLGLMTGTGRHYSGDIVFSNLDLDTECCAKVRPSISCLNLDVLLGSLPKRARNSHKGKHGHTLLVGGNTGFGGAIILAAQASARMGGGLLSLITRPENSANVLARTPEAMVHSISNPEQAPDLRQTQTLYDKAGVIGIGPGLGQDSWAKSLLQNALQSEAFLVIDADALNLLATDLELQALLTKRKSTHILTPHPGEAARLLKCATHDIENDRLKALKALQTKFGGHVLLKGSGTLLAHPSTTISLNPYGNPGMASGGMGDVLTGMIAGLMSNYKAFVDAETLCNLACCLHACAADEEAKNNGEIGMLASDLPQLGRRILNNM